MEGALTLELGTLRGKEGGLTLELGVATIQSVGACNVLQHIIEARIKSIPDAAERRILSEWD